MKPAEAHGASGTHFPNPLPRPYRPAPITVFSEVDATRAATNVGTRRLWPAIGLNFLHKRASSARSAIFAFPGIAEQNSVIPRVTHPMCDRAACPPYQISREQIAASASREQSFQTNFLYSLHPRLHLPTGSRQQESK